MSNSKPRAPESIRSILRTVIDRVEKGLVSETEDTFIRYKSVDFQAGYKEALAAGRGWRDCWIEPYLRQVMAYLDGEYTAKEIIEYGNGTTYKSKDSSCD